MYKLNVITVDCPYCRGDVSVCENRAVHHLPVCSSWVETTFSKYRLKQRNQIMSLKVKAKQKQKQNETNGEKMEKEIKNADNVNHPSHYIQNGIETLDVIEAWGLDYNLGNAVKYISRAGKKDPSKTVEDLEKARFYLDREIANLKKRDQ